MDLIPESWSMSHSDKPSIDDVIAHFGTKGMKWGVRRGKSTTGISRSRGAVIDRNARQRDAINKMLSGKKYRVSAAINKATFLGTKRYTKYFNKRISRMDAQDKRLQSNGKSTVRDKIDMTLNVGTLERHVSIRPRNV